MRYIWPVTATLSDDNIYLEMSTAENWFEHRHEDGRGSIVHTRWIKLADKVILRLSASGLKGYKRISQALQTNMVGLSWRRGFPVTAIFLNTLTCLSLASTTENPGPCFPSSPCGLNTECEVDENGAAVCNCLPGFQLIPGSDPPECEGGGLGLVDDLEDWNEDSPSPTRHTPTPCFLPAGTNGACVPVSKCIADISP